jgi:hypothetical protein
MIFGCIEVKENLGGRQNEMTVGWVNTRRGKRREEKERKRAHV